MTQMILHSISQLLTLEPLVKSPYPHRIAKQDLGIVHNGWLAIDHGKVAEFGAMPLPSHYEKWQKVQSPGKLILPGLVDSHTHPLFAGSRTEEFVMRTAGKTYEQIAAAGGGILTTVSATRDAPEQLLKDLTKDRLEKSLRYGVTTCEVKSGYGLSMEEELRHLRILQTIAKSVQQTLSITAMPLHGRSPEYETNEDYVTDITKNFLPIVAHEAFVDAVDLFLEKGYFEADSCHGYAQTAKELGLNLRVHADEFSSSGGAEYAAKWGAKSADHLQFASHQGIQAMAKAGVVATILPGTSLYCAIPFTQGRRFVDAGCQVAIATDYNPGSCRLQNLGFMGSLAAIHCQLTLPEVIAGITHVAAKSLGLHHKKGSLTQGSDADFIILQEESYEDWLAAMAQTPPLEVWVAGRKVY